MGDRATTIDTQTYHVAATATKPARFYRPELDILRFFAFFAVYVTHSLSHNPADWMRYHFPRIAAELMAAIARSGRFGVTLFFLLSAYLITSLLLREKSATSDVSLGSFYIRRILRIWPLYFFVLALAVAWPWTGRLPLSYLAWFLLLAGNWGLIILGSPYSWASILWSISIEEQFYLSWPLVAKRFSRQALLGSSVGLIVLANLARIYLAMRSPQLDLVWVNTFAQLDSFGAGIFCAILLNESVPRFSPAMRSLFGAIGVVLLIGCGHFESQHRAFVIFGYPAGIAGCLLLFLAVYGLALNFRPLVYLGKISYGLYAYHMLALTLMGQALGGRSGTPLRFLAFWCGGLIITLSLASLSYRWLESPFLRLKEHFAVIRSRPV
jgi:peptidoglycan/LPS O-acetylase OafA/YrhL